jgi:tetratricopeptide (TPR) repeat protein
MSESKHFLVARSKALSTQARLTFWMQDFNLSSIAAQESLDLARACGDKISEIDALFAVGFTDFHASIELYKQALSLSRSVDDPWREAYALAHLGGYNNMLSQVEEGAALLEKIGDLETSSDMMLHVVWRNMVDGNLKSAQKWLDKVAKVIHNLSNKTLEAVVLQDYGRIALIEGDYKSARDDLEKSLELAKAVGHQMYSLWSSVHLGYVAVQEGNLKEAYDIFANTAQEFQKDKSESGVVFTLEGMASLKVAADKPVDAARLIGWADATRKETNDPRPLIEQADVDKIIAACIANMGEAAFSDAYDEGQKMSLDEAVAYALREGG